MDWKHHLQMWLGQNSNSLIIGIDGLSGAGKTTLVNVLEEQVRALGRVPVVLHIDDFITPRSVRYNDNYEEWYCYYVLQWRYDYLIEQVLAPLRAGEHVRTQVELYRNSQDDYVLADVEITPGAILLLEGVFLQRPELRSHLDHVIYLDVSQEVRLARLLKRDTGIGDEQAIIAKHNRRYFPAEDHYLVECEPTKQADLVIAHVDKSGGSL